MLASTVVLQNALEMHKNGWDNYQHSQQGYIWARENGKCASSEPGSDKQLT